MIAIRGLPAADIGPADIITRDELAVELRELFDAEYPQEERERDNVALRAFGLLEPDEDVAELQLQLLGDQVLGFYNKDEERMVVVSDAGLDVEARITYAHEYTHALQHAAFGPDAVDPNIPGEDDQSLAKLSLIEGDATATMLAWMLRHLTQEEILEYFAGAELPDTTGIPSWMVDQSLFPYDAGLTWTTALAGGDPTNPDFTEVDAAHGDLPDSTEQILELDKWEAREAPDEVVMPDLAAALGEGWEEVDSTPIGQASINIMLEFFGVPVVESRRRAKGGVAIVPWSSRAQTTRLPWRGGSAWDSPGRRAGIPGGLRDGRRRARLSCLGHPAEQRRDPGGSRLDRRPAAADGRRGGTDLHRVGAEIPSRSRPLASTDRVASTSARRADESASSSVSTLQSR